MAGSNIVMAGASIKQMLNDTDVQKIASEDSGGLLATSGSVAKLIAEVERHFHNSEIWFGSGGTEDSLTPYTLVSGNNDFGDAVQLLAPGDTPFVSGNVMFDAHRVDPVSLDTASTYYIRLIWDSVSAAAGEAARQYTTFPVTPSGVGSNVSGTISDVLARRTTCGTDYLWAKCKNATNEAEIDILVGIHEYIG